MLLLIDQSMWSGKMSWVSNRKIIPSDVIFQSFSPCEMIHHSRSGLVNWCCDLLYIYIIYIHFFLHNTKREHVTHSRDLSCAIVCMWQLECVDCVCLLMIMMKFNSYSFIISMHIFLYVSSLSKACIV